MEYDPECTFQPHISEMSERIMRKYSKYDFYERSKIFSGREQKRQEKMKDQEEDAKAFPFHPKIIPQAPKFKEGVLETKRGVKEYLDKLQKLRNIKERQSHDKKQRKSKSPYNITKGPKVTVPEEQNLRLNSKKENAYGQKFDKAYLSKLKGVEHKAFLEGLQNNQNMIHVKNVPYKDAVNQLHDQLYALNLEDYASKIKIKRRIY